MSFEKCNKQLHNCYLNWCVCVCVCVYRYISVYLCQSFPSLQKILLALTAVNLPLTPLLRECWVQRDLYPTEQQRTDHQKGFGLQFLNRGHMNLLFIAHTLLTKEISNIKLAHVFSVSISNGKFQQCKTVITFAPT